MDLLRLSRWISRRPLGKALVALEHGEAEEAARLLEERLAQAEAPAPDLILHACQAHTECARLRLEKGDVHGGRRALQRAIELQPNFPDLHCKLARLLEESGEWPAARQAYEHALVINPRYLEARLSLARVLAQLGEEGTALAHLQEAVANAPESTHHELRAVIGEGPGLDRAHLVALCSQLVGVANSQVAAGLDAVRQALRRQDDRTAIDTLKQLLLLKPDYADLHNLLGVAYDNASMTDDAIEEFERALEINPGFLDARVNLGLALYSRGRFAQAEQHLRRVAALQPGQQVAQAVLAEIENRAVVS